MFECVMCSGRFTVEDVESGRYFPSTGGCFECYKTLAKNKRLCFGKEKLYDTSTLACRVECPDKRICRTFVKYRHKLIH